VFKIIKYISCDSTIVHKIYYNLIKIIFTKNKIHNKKNVEREKTSWMLMNKTSFYSASKNNIICPIKLSVDIGKVMKAM